MEEGSLKRKRDADDDGDDDGDDDERAPRHDARRPRHDVSLVSSHYNAREEQGLARRELSDIVHLRKFNNWIKAVLIRLYAKPRDVVFDMCCGKGGDLQKWSKAGVAHVVGVDNAAVSVQQARDRYRERPQQLRADFLTGDCFSSDLLPALQSLLPHDRKFDVVSCQFSLHYAFESEQRVRQMLVNVTQLLKPGGVFIGTIPNASVIVQRLRECGRPEFGNSVYRIAFDRPDPDHFNVYGERYTFDMTEAISDCPEYLVHFSSFKALCAGYGLQLELDLGFHEFFDRHVGDPENQSLLLRMGAVPSQGAISQDEWDAIGLYRVFAFRRTAPEDDWE